MHTQTLSVNWKNIVAVTVLSIALLGCFTFTTKAEAASTDALITESLPNVHKTTQLVLGALKERISAEPQLAAATVTDPQIAALMKLLEQLITMYNAILAERQGSDDADDDDIEEDETLDLPDLRVISVSPTTVNENEMTTYKVVVKNVGLGDAIRSFSVNINGTEVKIPRLMAGKTVKVTGAFGLPNVGNNEICIPVDIWDAIDESNESNNETCVNVRVIQSDYEDEGEYDVNYSYSSSQSDQNMNTDFVYDIENYNSNLVMDVEIEVTCDDTYIAPTFRRDCSQYLFNVSGKAAEQYLGVQADPFVKGGSLYRFSGKNGHLYITGYPNPAYSPSGAYIIPRPDEIEYRFILREEGREVWSVEKTAGFKG